MLVRLFAGIVGAAIVACVTHSSVMASGGYYTDRAPLLISLSAGLIAGSAVVGICWNYRRAVLALLIGSAIVAGEAYTLIQTAERTLASRDDKQAPIAAAEASRILAQARIARATDAKASADKAVLAKASEKSCAVNCRALLEQQVSDAKRELDAARAALGSMPVVGSPSPLADRLGVDPWKVDLAAAALISIAANGLGAFLIAFAAHGPRPERIRTVTSVAIEAPIADITPSTPKIIREPTKKLERDPLAEAAAFASAQFRPSANGRVELKDIRTAYHNWCLAQGRPPLASREIGSSLNQLFSRVGLGRDGSAIVGIEWSNAITQTEAA